MALTREQIVDAALGILREYGLADLSMRRLARDLDVQVGALYWHIKNKQDLLTVLAGRILEPVGEAATVRELAVSIRGALLAVRDGAEVVALAHVLAPAGPSALQRVRGLLDAQGLSVQESRWAADALVNYILGTVTQEQTRAGLSRAGLLDGVDDATDSAFAFGLELFLAGLGATAEGPSRLGSPAR
ncbi:MAG: TetR/AcrR family transcriptional regulator C-terminal domain-containing protein [Specibacter sp.]